jgi:hypothetical protein
MGFFMNEKILEVTIINKNVTMRNDLKTHTSITYSEETVTPSELFYRLSEKKIKTQTENTTYYDNYIVTSIEAIDEKDQKTYSLKIFKDEFLPVTGDTIKVCINDGNEIIAYIPYQNATPVSTIKQHKFEPIDYYKSAFIIYAFPITSPFYALSALLPVKNFTDGKYKNTYFFAFFALLIIAIQLYSSYNLYKYGGEAFIKSIIGYLISGLIYVLGLVLFDLRESLSKSLYINKIKQMLK